MLLLLPGCVCCQVEALLQDSWCDGCHLWLKWRGASNFWTKGIDVCSSSTCRSCCKSCCRCPASGCSRHHTVAALQHMQNSCFPLVAGENESNALLREINKQRQVGPCPHLKLCSSSEQEARCSCMLAGWLHSGCPSNKWLAAAPAAACWRACHVATVLSSILQSCFGTRYGCAFHAAIPLWHYRQARTALNTVVVWTGLQVRPLTHDLMKNMLQEVGYRVTKASTLLPPYAAAPCSTMWLA